MAREFVCTRCKKRVNWDDTSKAGRERGMCQGCLLKWLDGLNYNPFPQIYDEWVEAAAEFEADQLDGVPSKPPFGYPYPPSY
ncbi:hypothetical protein ES708_16392 [subsurface metagenome]